VVFNQQVLKMEQEIMIAAGGIGFIVAGYAARWWKKNRSTVVEEIADKIEDAIEDATGQEVDLNAAIEEVVEAAEDVVEDVADAVEAGADLEEIKDVVSESATEEIAELNEDLAALTVAELKIRLKDAGLPVSGNKMALMKRLEGSE